MKNIIFIGLLLSTISIKAQSLRVYLTDKEFSEEIITENDLSLSEKAISRRIEHQIPFDIRDVGISQNYLNILQNKGAKIKAQSRWFNYVVVESISEKELVELPFVKRVEYPKKYELNISQIGEVQNSLQATSIDYGMATTQIEMVKGNVLHDQGYQGEGMTIAVIDGGFIGTDTGSAFDSLWMNNRILGTKAFTGNSTIYEDGSHGTKVLSILGGFVDGQFAGSAPRANYWLLKSEKESSEKIVEMDNWLMAAEFADSVGADIISSSLGYNEFDGGSGNYSYSDMDGNTTIVTKAADMAAKKGILVIVSAGNEGASAWRHITAPADGDSVLAIGAVNNLGNRASFSSVGPTSDGRLKPDVMAMGQATSFSGGVNVLAGNGTSFSCPIISGMAACLWQLNSSKSNMEIFETIKSSGSRVKYPDNDYGFGIPNFEHAFFTIGIEEQFKNMEIQVFPNPVTTEKVTIEVGHIVLNQNITARLMDINGKELMYGDVQVESESFKLDFPYSEGVYILQLEVENYIYTTKILK